jgi:anti-sigma regulatory factor (Ser/Thr protein kinase)
MGKEGDVPPGREDLVMSESAVQSRPFAHVALLYEGEQEFLEQSLSFIRDGLAADEPVFVVVQGPKAELLRQELNGGADGVLFADMAEVGGNPARIIPAWQEFVAVHEVDGRPARGIGEPISPHRTADELIECQRHESLLNLALADARAFTLLCPYDAQALEEPVIEEALRSHPHVMRRNGSRPSPSYRGLDAIAAPFDAPLPEPPPSAEELVVDRESLVAARHRVSHLAAAAGFSRAKTSDLVLAVNEVLTNSVRHGGGRGLLRIWQEDGSLVCEIADAGRIEDPLVDRRRPLADQSGGRGLWMANQLCDLMQLRSFPDGSAVRVRMRRG